MLYVCKLEYCPENVRFTDILKSLEICVISGEFRSENRSGIYVQKSTVLWKKNV